MQAKVRKRILNLWSLLGNMPFSVNGKTMIIHERSNLKLSLLSPIKWSRSYTNLIYFPDYNKSAQSPLLLKQGWIEYFLLVAFFFTLLLMHQIMNMPSPSDARFMLKQRRSSDGIAFGVRGACHVSRIVIALPSYGNQCPPWQWP